MENIKENLNQFDAEIKEIEILFGPKREGDIPHSLASIKKAIHLLNYQPSCGIKEGLDKSLKWYWENN